MNRSLSRQADAGFTMIEVLVAIALTGLILGALVAVTAQWMPNWSRGLVQVQRVEQVAIALDRLAADLAAAEFVSPNRATNAPLFRGAEFAVTFVRSALGPNSRAGLEFVQIIQTNDAGGPVLVRMRAPFALLPTGDLSFDHIPFADPVVLLRAPFRLAFAYAGPDGKWTRNWRNAGELPAVVRFDIQDAQRRTTMSTATRVYVDIGAPRPEPGSDARPEVSQAQSNKASEVR
jgi:general secretion pathway protein J